MPAVRRLHNASCSSRGDMGHGAAVQHALHARYNGRPKSHRAIWLMLCVGDKVGLGVFSQATIPIFYSRIPKLGNFTDIVVPSCQPSSDTSRVEHSLVLTWLRLFHRANAVIRNPSFQSTLTDDTYCDLFINLANPIYQGSELSKHICGNAFDKSPVETQANRISYFGPNSLRPHHHGWKPVQ